MSPRAALRLETLDFREVYDYVPGKADWLAHPLPREGRLAAKPRAGDLVRQDVVRCRLEAPIEDLGKEIDASEYGFALVVGDDDVLLGRIRKSAVRQATGTAEAIMEPGPSTIRPDTSIEHVEHTMHEHDLKTMLVSTPEGRLLGVIRREDVGSATAQED